MLTVVKGAIWVVVSNILVSHLALAEEKRTNINQVTDFFNQEIEEKAEMEQLVEDAKQKANAGIAGKNALQELGISEVQAVSKSRELNSINPYDLSSKGQEERNKPENSYFDSLELDVTKPSLLEHKKDVDLIASSTGQLMGTLTKGLKDLGLDCKEVRGNQEEIPEYYINIQKKEEKDTIYDQVFCEALRNSYSCKRQLIMRCKKQGYQLGAPEIRSFTYNWQNIPGSWKDLTIIGGQNSYCRWYTMRNNPAIMAEIRADIARDIQANLEQIESPVDIPPIRLRTGWEEDDFLAREFEVKDHVNIEYRFCKGIPICLEWDQEWHEVCDLN